MRLTVYLTISNLPQCSKSHSSSAPRKSNQMLRIVFQLLFDAGRILYIWSECGEMQHFIPRQSSLDNTHTLYKVNLILCELTFSKIPDKHRSWVFTYILVFSSVSFSRRGAYFTAFYKRNSFLNPSLTHRFSQSLPPSLNLTWSRKSFMLRDLPTVTGVNSLDGLHVILSCHEALADSSFWTEL